MVDSNKDIEWDKLPAMVKTTSFRESSDEYLFTLATERKYEEYAKAFMAHISSRGVIFFVPCTAEQVDQLLGKDAAPSPILSHAGERGQGELVEGRFVDVATMADLFGMTERNVQLQAEKGLLVRSVRGQYDTLASCGTLWKALQEQNSGKNDAYNEARTKGIQLKTKERELNYLERAGKLGNIDAIQAVIEKAKASEKQQVLFMPKQLAPLFPDPPVAEAILEEWGYAFLKGQTEINIAVDLVNIPKADMDKMPELKKQGVSRKARKARKGKQ